MKKLMLLLSGLLILSASLLGQGNVSFVHIPPFVTSSVAWNNYSLCAEIPGTSLMYTPGLSIYQVTFTLMSSGGAVNTGMDINGATLYVTDQNSNVITAKYTVQKDTFVNPPYSYSWPVGGTVFKPNLVKSAPVGIAGSDFGANHDYHLCYYFPASTNNANLSLGEAIGQAAGLAYSFYTASVNLTTLNVGQTLTPSSNMKTLIMVRAITN